MLVVTESPGRQAEGRAVPHIQRRRRVRCRLRCELLEGRRRRSEAAVVSLSEGGLSLELGRPVEQGEALRLRIASRPGGPGVLVDAIAWNLRRASSRSRGARGGFVLGCVVSDPSPDFLRLLARMEQRDAVRASLPARGAMPLRRSAPPPPERLVPAEGPEPPIPLETDLPRSRAPLPPPKPEPEETLPSFRVRLKQVGGPRTRNLRVRARSLGDAEARALAEVAADAATWHILDVIPG